MTIDLTRNQAYLFSTLQAFKRPITCELAARLIHQSIPQLEKLAAPMRERGFLVQQGDYLELGPDIPAAAVRSFAEQNDRKRIAEIARTAKTCTLAGHGDALAILGLLWANGNIKDATHLAWNRINEGVKDRRYKEALEIAFWASSRLEVIIEHTGLWPTAIDLVITFNRLDYIFKEYHTKTVEALELVREPCQHLGDERRLALVLLHLGRRYIALNNPRKSDGYFQAGFEIVERLGDSDIEGQANPFYALYYSCQGLSQKAMIRFEQIGYPDPIGIDESIPDPQIAVTAAIQAAIAGEYQIAIGALDANVRWAIRKGELNIANFYRTFLGQILLMNGLLDEARLHLDAVLADTNPQEEAYLIFCVSRAKAYYLLLQGRVREAYEMLSASVAESFQEGWHRYFWGFPWILEMLYYFHRAGYPPIPDYEYKAEIKNALTNRDIQIKGTAFRLRAEEATLAGENPNNVGELLQTSEKCLIEAGNPAELAKTRAQLALWYSRVGDQFQARQLAQQAWRARSSMGCLQLPSEIRSLIGDAADAAPGMINSPDVLVRFLDMIDSWRPTANRQEMLRQIIANTTRFFHAERGAIFLLKGQSEKQHLVFCQGCNLSPEDIPEHALQIYHQQAREAIEENRPLIVREVVVGNAISRQGVKCVLCIPLKLSDAEQGMLYYDTVHLNNAFDWCDNFTLTRIAESIKSVINRTLEFTRHLEMNRRLTIPALTELSEEKSGAFTTSGQLFQKVIQRAERASLSDAPVLILGETGAGKEVIAKRVHLTSNRRDKPFIAVNLASIPETLLESELFGHEKGAFTGAEQQKLGRMELANKGTLFIDEVGDIPKLVQVKLLRALEEMSFVRIGGVVKREVDFRLIAATNRDLTKEVELGNFRADLYYRLNVIPIFLPPLRERGDDVFELAQKFLERSAQKYRLPVHSLTSKEKEWIKTYHWPGNIRELKNVMERAVILNSGPSQPSNPILELPSLANQNVDYLVDRPTMDEMQRRFISRIMEETNQNLSQAANILGMKRTTLYKRMVKLGLR